LCGVRSFSTEATVDNVRFREFRSTCSARQYGIQGNWHQRYPFETCFG